MRSPARDPGLTRTGSKSGVRKGGECAPFLYQNRPLTGGLNNVILYDIKTKSCLQRMVDQGDVMSNESKARRILNFHGVALVALGVGNTVVSLIATKTEISGPFHFLYKTPFVEVGLMQAYLLMSLVGVLLTVGAKTEKFYIFDIAGIVAHCIPLLALFTFRPIVFEVMGVGTFYASLGIHVLFISLELLALYFTFRRN